MEFHQFDPVGAGDQGAGLTVFLGTDKPFSSTCIKRCLTSHGWLATVDPHYERQHITVGFLEWKPTHYNHRSTSPAVLPPENVVIAAGQQDKLSISFSDQ